MQLQLNKTSSVFWKYVIVLLITIIGVCKSAMGQATVPVSRTAWGSTPTGWTDGQGGSPTYSSDLCGGSDGTSGRLDNTGEYFIVNYSTGASGLTFCLKGNGFSGGTFTVEESTNGTAWTTVQTYTTLSTAAAGSSESLTLNCNSRYVRFIYTTKSSGNVQLDNVAITQGTCSGCTDPTTAASSPVVSQVGCNGFKISWTNGNGANRLVVLKAGSAPTAPTDGLSYTGNASFGSGSTTAAGSYVVYAGNGSSVSIYNLSASTTYYYAIYEYNSTCYLTSSSASGSQATTSCSATVGATALYVDACSGSCGWEGNNELIWCNSGSYYVPIGTNSPKITYGTTPSPTTIPINTYGSNSTNTAAMNTAVGACGTTTFIDAGALGYVPPNSAFVIANDCFCDPSAYDFSNLCGQTIYVYYGNNSTWTCGSTGGVFGNHASSGTAYFDLDFTAFLSGVSNEFNYDKNTLASSDGAYVTFSTTGGAATSYGSGACTVPTIVLSVKVEEFTAKRINNTIGLIWRSSDEVDLSGYLIEKSNDADNYRQLATVAEGSGRAAGEYSFTDADPSPGLNYYKLSSIDNNGKVTYQKSVVVDFDHLIKDNYAIYYGEGFVQLELKNVEEGTSIEIVDLSGVVVANYQSSKSSNGLIKINSDEFTKGMYLLRITRQNKVWNDKIIIR